jgi:thymidylate synthase ThyX
MDYGAKRDIYTLEGISPEVKAVTFAKCSRSPESFRDIAEELTDEKSAEFHEKWVVGFGHSSVAEHAILSIAIENVSNIATKIIEDGRLASYTEKSSRYQIFDKERYYKPKKVMESDLAELYVKTADMLFDTYNELLESMNEYMKKKCPQTEKQSDKVYASVIKAKVCDNIRYLLPAATQTNLGMTVNARQLEHSIKKMLSHPLKEMQEIAQEIKRVALQITPTLIQFADYNEYFHDTREALEKKTQEIMGDAEISPADPVKIVNYDKDAEKKLVTALLYPGSKYSYEQIYDKVKSMSDDERANVVDEALSRRSDYDAPIRELEHVYYTYDILMDYGAFRDVQRHRMCTQSNQEITTAHGYSMPEDIIDAGFKDKFCEAMDRAHAAFEKIYEKFPKEAQYIVPMAFRKRTLFTWNYRELHHFISLRSGKKGHISYRRIAQECWNRLNEIHPLLAKFIRVDMSAGSSSWAASLHDPSLCLKPKQPPKENS